MVRNAVVRASIQAGTIVVTRAVATRSWLQPGIHCAGMEQDDGILSLNRLDEAIRMNINITKRVRRRTQKSSGEILPQIRWVLNFRDPLTHARRQLFFAKQKDAAAKRNDLLRKLNDGSYSLEREKITVEDAVRRWLADREGETKPRTHWGYRFVAERYIIGPLIKGTARERVEFTTRRAAGRPEYILLLGGIRISELTTARIREWHKTLLREVGSHSANRAKQYLGTALALAAEDFGFRPPAMPRKLGRGKSKPKKSILRPDQIAVLLKHARTDQQYGIYYAFPFLVGTRPSEQLGLLWEDVDFERNVIRIRRMQENNGSLTEFTKTEAGFREVPMGSLIRELLLEWRVRCPRLAGELHRVFPAHGHAQPWPLLKKDGGGSLLYANFRKRLWLPAFAKAGVPYVTPHSARHSFISTLQSQGIEIGLVAKLAGHANPAVTAGYYTHAVRGGEAAIEALEVAIRLSKNDVTATVEIR